MDLDERDRCRGRRFQCCRLVIGMARYLCCHDRANRSLNEIENAPTLPFSMPRRPRLPCAEQPECIVVAVRSPPRLSAWPLRSRSCSGTEASPPTSTASSPPSAWPPCTGPLTPAPPCPATFLFRRPAALATALPATRWDTCPRDGDRREDAPGRSAVPRRRVNPPLALPRSRTPSRSPQKPTSEGLLPVPPATARVRNSCRRRRPCQ
jgi:hypothetical protein